MTRKHYVQLAERLAIIKQLEVSEANEPLFNSMIKTIADTLKADNSSFDYYKFYAAVNNNGRAKRESKQ